MEIIELLTSEKMECPSWGSYPFDSKGAVGGLLGTNPIVCGGIRRHHEEDSDEYSDEYTNECRIVTPKSTEKFATMLSKRYSAASLVIKETILWVTGGSDGIKTLSSSEFIEIETTAGPELPVVLEGHKMIEITDDLTLFIGGSFRVTTSSTTLISTTTTYMSTSTNGCHSPSWVGDNFCDDETNTVKCNYDGGDCCGANSDHSFCTYCVCFADIENAPIPLAATFYFDHDKSQYEKGSWSEGPTMIYKRKHHSVGIVADRITLEKFVVVTGGEDEEGAHLTTEILIKNEWSLGKITKKHYAIV